MTLSYQLFKHLLFTPMIKVFWRPWVQGHENIPTTGAVIMAANHISIGDPILLAGMIKRPMAYPAKAEAFEKGRSPKDRIIAWFLKTVGMLPLDRSGGRASADSLGVVGEVLEEGQKVLGIFPEGTRSPDGRLYKGKTGVARLALATGAPVVPVAMFDTAITPGLFGIPRMIRPGIRIGKPLDFSAYRDRPTDRVVLRWVTDEIVNAIHQLSGQEYVDVYGASAKSGNFTEEQLAARVLPRPGANTERPALPAE